MYERSPTWRLADLDPSKLYMGIMIKWSGKGYGLCFLGSSRLDEPRRTPALWVVTVVLATDQRSRKHRIQNFSTDE